MMHMLCLLVYMIGAIVVFNGVRPVQGESTITLTSTTITGRATVTTQISEVFESSTATWTSTTSLITATGTITTIWSEILIIPTTNALGQTIDVTETITTTSFPVSLPTPHPAVTIFSSQAWWTTTDSLGETIITWSWSVTTIPPANSISAPTSDLNGQSSSQGPSPTVSTTPSATSPPTSTSQKGPKKAQLAPILTVVGIIVGVFFIWLFRRCARRDEYTSQPRGDTSSWKNPFNDLGRALPYKNNKSQGTKPDHTISRPMISSPIPFFERSTSPPNRPARPISLSDSLMEDMRTSPQPRIDAQTITGTSANNGQRSFSPEPLRVVKPTQPTGPYGSDLERNHRNQYATTSRSSSVYSTATAGPSQPRPTYQPYRQPELHRQVGQYFNEDEEDPEVRRAQREETLRKLEENEALAASEGEEDEVKSQGSYDFAEARARKVLEDKRIREQVWGKSRANSPDNLPTIPELPGSPNRWV